VEIALRCAAVPAHRRALAVLTTGALALGAAPAAAAPSAAKPATCKAPHAGYQSCLRVRYKPAKTDAVEQVRVTATLVRDAGACPHRTARRALVITSAGDELATVRRAGHCAKGVVTWRAQFSSGRTGAWDLRAGDTVTATWSGVRRTSSVRIQPR
jgi:hypothetical protein